MVHQDQQGRLCWPKHTQKTDFSFYAYVNVNCKWTDMVGCNSQSGLESATTWPYIEHDLKAWLEKHNFQNIWTKSGDLIAINSCCCTFYPSMAKGVEIDFSSRFQLSVLASLSIEKDLTKLIWPDNVYNRATEVFLRKEMHLFLMLLPFYFISIWL